VNQLLFASLMIVGIMHIYFCFCMQTHWKRYDPSGLETNHVTYGHNAHSSAIASVGSVVAVRR